MIHHTRDMWIQYYTYGNRWYSRASWLDHIRNVMYLLETNKNKKQKWERNTHIVTYVCVVRISTVTGLHLACSGRLFLSVYNIFCVYGNSKDIKIDGDFHFSFSLPDTSKSMIETCATADMDKSSFHFFQIEFSEIVTSARRSWFFEDLIAVPPLIHVCSKLFCFGDKALCIG